MHKLRWVAEYLFWSILFLLSVIIIAFFFTGCAALHGRSGYEGPYMDGPYLEMNYRRMVAAVDNPTARTLSVDLLCTLSEFHDVIIPPRTTQTFLLFEHDLSCEMTWRVVKEHK